VINTHTLGILLRTLQRGEGSPLAPSPPAPVAPAAPAALVAEPGAHGQAAFSGEPNLRRNPTAATPTGSGAPLAPPLSDLAAAPSVASANNGVTLAANQPAAAVALAAAPVTAVIIVPEATASASLELSGAAQLVSRLLQQPRSAEQLAAIYPVEPLLREPPADAGELREALSASIARSGLFYESHLAEWTLQRFPQPELEREPQAAWPTPPATAATPSRTQTQATAAGMADALSLRTCSPITPLPDSSVPLVRQQLETLETRQIAWQGLLWPGQRAAITIAEDESAVATAVAPVWRTRLKLELQNLGRIEADLVLQGSALRLQLQPETAAGAARLQLAKPELIGVLSERFDLTGITILHERAS